MRTKVTNLGKEIIIEYEDTPVKYKDATLPCGNGVWLYDTERKRLWRWTLTSHELPYHYKKETWNVKGNHHLVLASSKPLWVWWGNSCMDLKWGDSGIALPQIK